MALEIIVSTKLAKSSGTSLNAELNKITIKPIKVPVTIDPKSLNSLKKTLGSISTKSSGSSSKNGIVSQIFNTDELDKEGRRYYKSASGIVDRLKRDFSSMGKVNVTGIFKDEKGVIQKLTADVTKLSGVVEKYNFQRSKLVSGNSKSVGFVQTNSVGADKLAGADLERKLDLASKFAIQLDNAKNKAYNLNKAIKQQDHVNNLDLKYNQIKTAIDNAQTSGKAFSKSEQRNIQTLLAEAERLRKAYQIVEYPATKLASKSVDMSKSEEITKLERLKAGWKESGILVGKFGTEVQALEGTLGKVFDKKTLDEYNHQLAIAQEHARGLKILSKSALNITDYQDSGTKMQTWLNENTKAAKIYSNEITKLQAAYKNISSPKELKQWKKDWKLFTDTAAADGNLGKGIFGSLLDKAKKFVSWTISTMGIMAVINTIKNMIKAVRELDTAMVELKKVTDESDSTYNRFLENASENAKKLGSTISDLVNATAEFARTGFSLGESEVLAQVATVYKNVGDGISSISDSSGILISTLKAFNLEATDSWHIVDALNEVGNRFSVGSSGLGESLKRSASALASANNTFEESLGLITSMDEILQDPEMTGRRNCPAA